MASRYFVAAILLILLVTPESAKAQSEVPPETQTKPARGLNLLGTQEIADGFRPGGYALNVLLHNKNVQDEIEMTEDQKTEFQNLDKKIQDQRKAYREKIQNALKIAREKNQPKQISDITMQRNAYFAKWNDEFETAIQKKLLNKKQVARLREIRYQAEGPFIFTRVDIQETLGLDEEQIDSIGQIIKSAQVEYYKAANLPSNVNKPNLDNPDDPNNKKFTSGVQKAQGEIGRIRARNMSKIEEVLTKGQRVAYRKLVGKPFDFAKPQNAEEVKKEESVNTTEIKNR